MNRSAAAKFTIDQLREVDRELAEDGKRMTDWEVEFLETIFRQQDWLTPKQEQVAQRILENYRA